MSLSEKKFYTQNEYFGISNSIFNFNFLALVISKILGGPKFTLGGLHTFDAPYQRNFCTLSEYYTISNCVFNFSFLSLILYEILGGPKFTLRSAVPLWMPLSEKNFIPKTFTLAYLIAFFISTF